MSINRRSFFKGAIAASIAPTATLSLSGCAGSNEVFAHGVASGDPLSDSVILWTRVSLTDDILKKINRRSIKVYWEIALDIEFNSVSNSGIQRTNKNKDFTVKVDTKGLSPNTRYFYRFLIENIYSPIGKTKTLPVGNVEQLKLAYTSCSHYGFGYFNVYARIAEHQDLDAVLHLGDYLYEYGNTDVYRNPLLINRRHEPAHEMISLEDYRTRHAQYKTDQDLQTLHGTHPMICIWDDHEFCNDAYKDGAQNHDPETEGSWLKRSETAIKAYYEWMPIREPSRARNRDKSYRNFRFGNLLDLNILDTRFIGRDKQIESFDGSELDPSRSLLGYEQENWLENNLLQAKSDSITWSILGQQVQMMQLQLAGKYLNKDAWDGYQASRNKLLDFISDNELQNVVVLTGDVHSSWATEIAKNPYDLDSYNPESSEGAVAVEFVSPSVTSPSIPIPGIQQIIGNAAQILRKGNPHIKYIDIKNRGYVKLTINQNQVKADWYHVPVVGIKNDKQLLAKTFIVNSGTAKLIEQ